MGEITFGAQSLTKSQSVAHHIFYCVVALLSEVVQGGEVLEELVVGEGLPNALVLGHVYQPRHKHIGDLKRGRKGSFSGAHDPHQTLDL